jgi:hypothetical protein
MPVPEAQMPEQLATPSALLQSLGSATHAEVEQVLAGHHRVTPETGLTPKKMQARERSLVRRKGKSQSRATSHE